MSEIRVGDAEREQAASALGDHYAAGRLDPTEYAERLDAAWSARTRADLTVLFTDLPPAAPQPAPGFGATAGRGRSGRSGRDGLRLPFPVLALAVLVVGGLVITHLPFLVLFLVALVLFKVARAGHRRDRMRARWGGGPGHW
jgi:hypothetical protein